MQNTRYIGHLAALITIATWGTTFISTKVLLTGFQPLEILFFRFIMAFFALWLAYPKMLKTDKKQEPVFMAAGLCGICLYYLLENIALTYTQASNVSVIGSTAPFFTALLTHYFMHSAGSLSKQFIIGFFIVMSGIACISFNGAAMQLNPLGDLLAIFRCRRVGVLCPADEKNQQLWLSCYPRHSQNLFLRHSLYAADAGLSGF